MNLLNLKNTLQTSLVIRLTFLFLLTTIIIWLLSVLTAAYISMVQKRQHIIEDLSVLSEMNIVLSNQRFEEAERDAKNLMYQCSLATEIHHNDIFPEVSRHLSVGLSNCTPTLNGE
ncbi:two component system sensor kinase SsrA, partial [Salmonella enterica subsp. enterica serovar Cerro]|nr:two component system sensor kinase SsrA [Salmonella enterica]